MENIEVIEDLEITNNEIILEKGYYKISWGDDFALLKLNEDVWYTDLNKFIYNRYSEIDYKMKKIDYIVGHKEVRG